ncbi:hypothetical protein DM860_001584 [Cuscuta australis]|uniref:SANT domain-containing protein n=1 Tax=Cuscuta australis TaxID=267555 RepID=A0A328EAQ5_9ASTE|nr:hypothetical protein DM860_001584 [Cuscuta australis]
MAAGKLLPTDSPKAGGVFGEPQIFPRVGEQYQVDIPPYTQNWTDDDDSWDVFVGLHIPLRWANLGGKTNQKLDGSQIASSSSGPESSSDIILEDGKLINASIEDKQPKGECPGYCLLPDGIVDPWTKNEKAGFLLGLYVFEKDFTHLKRFVQTKKACDIMSYYYGEFYGSDEYRRWSDGRKVRSRKCVYGQKLFTGSRLQELLGRLLPHMSAERQNELLELSKTFGEGKVQLEEFVFTLKHMVGMASLIEAVGIGQGKQDLTNMTLEHTRSNHVITVRSEVPIGKACASLKPAEIIKYLTGGCRLSKTRSNDLFWEAVWPRLLARGWHSEQPKNMAYAAAGGGSKQSLVFLMPDVKKFSRKLIKGSHYFDSVTDVLSKVASEPKWIDLDTDDQDGKKKQEDERGDDGSKMDTDDLSTMRCHSYLQPRTPNQYTDDIKFTVVDTSLCSSKPYKVRNLRSFPLEISRKLCPQIHFEGKSKDNNVDNMSLDQTEPVRAGSNTTLPSGERSFHRKDHEVGATNRKVSHFRNQALHADNTLNNEDLCEDSKSRKVLKPCIGRKVKKENADNTGHVSKRPRGLTAGSHTETKNISCVSREEVPSYCLSIMPSSNALQMNSNEDRISSNVSSKSSPSESIERVAVNKFCVAEVSPAEHRPKVLIDLNVLPDSPGSENGVAVTDTTEEQTDSQKKPESHCELQLLSSVDTSGQQQPAMASSRRHSTRNRPPTTRVLEALANGFLTVNRRPKNKEAGSQQNLGSKSSQQAHGRTKTAGFGNHSQVSKIDEETHGVCSSRAKKDVFSKRKAPPNQNGRTIGGL